MSFAGACHSGPTVLVYAMSMTARADELATAVNRFVEALDTFSSGSGQLEELATRHDEILKLLRDVPGSVLLIPAGRLIWDRLVSTSPDRETAEGIAADLANVIKDGTKAVQTGLQFIDDTFTVVHDGNTLPPLDPLAYAVLKVLHAWRGRPVKMKQLVGHLDDPDLFRGRSRDTFPVLDDTPAGRRRVSRALKKLPLSLRRLIRGNRNGRMITPL
jgi:hypothetical protein